MTTAARAVLEQALGLDAVERAELIEALFRSFDASGESRSDVLWAAEAESRLAAHEAGKIPAAPAADVLRRISRR